MYTGYVTKYLCAADACLSFKALSGDLKRLPEPISHTAAGLNSTFSHNIYIRCTSKHCLGYDSQYRIPYGSPVINVNPCKINPPSSFSHPKFFFSTIMQQPSGFIDKCCWPTSAPVNLKSVCCFLVVYFARLCCSTIRHCRPCHSKLLDTHGIFWLQLLYPAGVCSARNLSPSNI